MMKIAYRLLAAFFIFVALVGLGGGDSFRPPDVHAADATTYYVDASVSSSGDGLSWETAWKSIGSATWANLEPGTTVLIKPGVYRERLVFQQSGAEIVPLTTRVEVSGHRITFPTGTDLSDIDLEAHSGQYYAYVYRSWASNNGVYPIIDVNVAGGFVIVSGAAFIDETGSDVYHVSASIGRPIVFRKYASEPENERVVVDVSQMTANTMLYIGRYITPGSADPVDYNIIDGIDLTGSTWGGGVHIQSSSFNVIQNSRIYDQNGVGILIAGHDEGPAEYNLIINNEISNTPTEGIYVGYGDGGRQYNHAHFTHIIDNEVFTEGTADNARLENAIDIKEYNQGVLVEGNLIRDIALSNNYNGALDVRNEANHSLIYNNVFRDITRRYSGTNHIINIFQDTQDVTFFNNLIYNTTRRDDDVYALHVQADRTQNVSVVHNTIYRIDRGMLLEYGTDNGNGSDNGLLIANNIFSEIPDQLIVEWVANGASKGHFELSNNLFPRNPGGNYSISPEFIGDPEFVNPAVEDFHLSNTSAKAINHGLSLNPVIERDFDLVLRGNGGPDLGAFEYPLMVNTPPLDTPELKSPKDRSYTADTTPTFKWSSVAGAVEYRLQIATDAAFTVDVMDTYVESRRYTLPDFRALDFGTYYWRVQASNEANDWSDWSSAAALTVTLLKVPSNGDFTTDDTPTFRWYAFSGAEQYQLQVSTDESFASTAIDTLVSGKKYVPNSALPHGRYFWRVRVESGGSWSPWTPAWVFTLTPEPPDKPVLVAPMNEADLDDPTPTFTWEAVPDGETYQIQIGDQRNFKSPVQDAVVDELTYTAAALSDGGTFYWRVRAINEYGVAGKWSQRWQFTLGGPAVPTLLSPAHKEAFANFTPDFAWTAVSTATTYQLQIGVDEHFQVIEQDVLVDTTHYMADPLVDGTYYWRVRTINAQGIGGDWSKEWRFTVDTVGPDAPILKSPRDASGTTDTTPAFKWRKPEGAVQYRIQLAGDSGFASPLVDVSSTRTKFVLSETEALSFGRYYWRVMAQDGVGNWGEWSEPFTFTITILKSPSDTSTVTDSTPPFKWVNVEGVTEYQLQVGHTPAFENPLIDVQVDSSRYTPDVSLADGTYYWRVSADGGASWTPAWTFTVTPILPSKPKLIAPENNTLFNNDDLIFMWYPVDSGYVYQVQIDDDKQFGSPAQDVVLDVGELTYTATALAESDWYWRVRAINSVGAAGAWSKRWSFTVDLTPPVIPLPTSPATDARVTNPKLTLEWEKVDGVERYEIQLDTSDAFPLPVIEVGRKNRYAPPGTLAQGAYYWRVRAVDEASNVSGWSTIQVFHIVAGDTAAPTPVPPPSDGDPVGQGEPPVQWIAPTPPPPPGKDVPNSTPVPDDQKLEPDSVIPLLSQ